MLQTVRRAARPGSVVALWMALALAACAPAAAPSVPAAAPKAAAPAAAQPATGAPAAAAPAGWDQLVAAAKQEGRLVIAGPPGQEYRGVAVEDFGKAYPGISVEYSAARSNEHVPRIMAERAAGRFLTDVYLSGQVYTVLTLKPAGAVVPLRPELVLPEVVDESAWLDNRLTWCDGSEPYTCLLFQGSAQGIIFYNTTLVNPAEFTSYWDALQPKWRGNIEATDIRPGVVGGVPSRFVYKNPALGPAWLEKLYGDMDVSVSGDQRQLIDRLAQGQFALAIFLSGGDVVKAAALGLPVSAVPSDQLKEGASVGPGNGAVAIMESAPHPNAARLFVNWLLSREGQMSWQNNVQEPSLRTDIPKDGLSPLLVPKPGISYVNAATGEYSTLTFSDIGDIVTRGLEKR
jgi:ABC-type Fe3+ transport system substrate-binding protein